MTSAQIRQSFLDFFKSKQHTIVPSSSLMPDSPGLLFTNAGMNQFVPIFLNQRKPDVSKWSGVIPGSDTRAADTQKCIRAGGKHNDLEDVGLDTYHHTFFEMLGNWSFGDYFKNDAIDWAWELIVEIWKFPPQRLYATVYNPDKAANDPSEFDQEAWDLWATKFRAVGLDPAVHIVNGNKKDNFWMMGETGPCGPCSELHVDLTPAGDTKGTLVNKGSAQCIEIWNLVFIQFTAEPDGQEEEAKHLSGKKFRQRFVPLPAKHVDTGMGFERVCGIIQNTRNFTDFTRTISNYDTDVFRPIFDKLEKLSGKKYTSTLPKSGSNGDTEQERIDVAFRVIADHCRTLGFSIADGIQPGNTDRNYVLRRILRRAVRYGRTLGFHEPFFYKLVDVLADHFGTVFPEIRERRNHVEDVIRMEEESFNKTLDRGIDLFNEEAAKLSGKAFSDEFVFKLYDTYGFPVDLTELMARERGLSVDKDGVDRLMKEQKDRARAAQKKEIVSVSNIDTSRPTNFVGFERFSVQGKVQEVVTLKDKIAVIFDVSPFYAEMGGQVGDTGELVAGGQIWYVANTQKVGNTFLHFISETEAPAIGTEVTLTIDSSRRNAIQRHHTVTHLLHWALHEVVSKEATQKGSSVGPDKLTFDFNSAPLASEQVTAIEQLVNERILENAPVSWTEVPYADIKGRKDVMQFFGEKYGDKVRVVQIGGGAGELNGYSMELCGGTHTRATGEIGMFRIIGESAIASGVRRIEAVAGLQAYEKTIQERELITNVAGKINSPIGEVEKKIEALLAQQKELEKQLKAVQQKQAAGRAKELVAAAKEINTVPTIIENLGETDGDTLQIIADALKSQFKGVIVLGGSANGAVALIAAVTPEYTAKVQAGKIIQAIAPIVGGKGGGKPDNARGGGKDASKLDEALTKAKSLL